MGNARPVNGLTAVNVQYLGSKMSSKREVSGNRHLTQHYVHIDLQIPANRMPLFPRQNRSHDHLPFERFGQQAAKENLL